MPSSDPRSPESRHTSSTTEPALVRSDTGHEGSRSDRSGPAAPRPLPAVAAAGTAPARHSGFRSSPCAGSAPASRHDPGIAELLEQPASPGTTPKPKGRHSARGGDRGLIPKSGPRCNEFIIPPKTPHTHDPDPTRYARAAREGKVKPSTVDEGASVNRSCHICANFHSARFSAQLMYEHRFQRVQYLSFSTPFDTPRRKPPIRGPHCIRGPACRSPCRPSARRAHPADLRSACG